MAEARLVRTTPAGLPELRRDAVDAETLAVASAIVEDVRARGEAALREHAARLGDLQEGGALVIERPFLDAALSTLDRADRDLLERSAERIRTFARAQRAALTDAEVPVPGGAAGHTVAPVERAGCYAPGGRFPLPSSVLMTAVTARAAGVAEVWVASPRPTQVTLAAAAVAGADAVLAVGGAQAIAALAYGAGPVPPVDVIVGPGNRFVTAAKQLVSGRVRIDMLAGPSELVVLCDATADPETVAADLLAQAEHDPDALPVVVSTDAAVLDAVDAALARQLAVLPTAPTASLAVAGGYSVLCADLDEAIAVCDRLAPEHLELSLASAAALAPRFLHYGGLFIGEGSAEVLGDYGAGPNHVLPTGSTARFSGGLSIFDFLRVRTWLRIDDTEAVRPLARDAAQLARLEGLEAHARAAERRS
ncbi:MAG: histidinol dehydrogenase [Deltaproteobacteria bacterium]|nr:histidinol dehydrogenase [Deltaproteobacteria bacterium]MCB9788025.1 histidinol dehydrogenase [Deltaproteobacteria bacterium]